MLRWQDASSADVLCTDDDGSVSERRLLSVHATPQEITRRHRASVTWSSDVTAPAAAVLIPEWRDAAAFVRRALNAGQDRATGVHPRQPAGAGRRAVAVARRQGDEIRQTTTSRRR